MESTGLNVGPHWEEYIRRETKSGRYGSVGKVVRAALRAHLAEGAGQAARADFIDGFDIEDVITRAKNRSARV